MYELNIFKLLHSFRDHIDHIKEAERINNIWKTFIILTSISFIIYIWMGYLGIGSNLILDSQYRFAPHIYEANKFWFFIGQAFYGILLSVVVVFVPAVIFKWLFSDVSFYHFIVMQLAVFVVVLVERLTWIPLVTIFGLDWFASPFSLGVIVSYMTSKSWLIYFFGSVSLFQLFIIIFQIKFLMKIVQHSKPIVYVTVIILHFFKFWLIALMTFISPYIIEGWF